MKRTELGRRPRAVCACGWKAPIAISWSNPLVAILVAANEKTMGMVCPECCEEVSFPLLAEPVPVRVDGERPS